MLHTGQHHEGRLLEVFFEVLKHPDLSFLLALLEVGEQEPFDEEKGLRKLSMSSVCFVGV